MEIIISNLNFVAKHTIKQQKKLVYGSSVRTKNLIRDIGAAFRNILGGEIKSYTNLLQEARQEAVSRMKKEAKKCRANTILGVRFSTSSIIKQVSEVFCYSTAVVLEEEKTQQSSPSVHP